MNKKELILQSFQKMDCSMLDVILDDSLTYQDATKEVFIDKLTDAFSKLKFNGDTYLIPFKGLCNYKHCTNKGCRGYSFVGNNSKNHIDLIFQEKNDEINDIYHCSGFETDDKTIDRRELISINVKHDEKANFKPSVNFLIKSQNCRLAIEELMQYKNTVINKDIYFTWLGKHYSLYKKIEMNYIFYSDLNEFHTLYYRINDLKEFLESNNLAKEALEVFQTFDKSKEYNILKWLTNYEMTGGNLTLFLYDDIDYENPNKTEYFEVNDFKIDTSDFKYIIQFSFLFDKYYWDMLEKYSEGEKVQDKIISFLTKSMQTIKDNHIHNSKEKYQLYLEKYIMYPRNEPQLNNEEEFINYLKSIENLSDFLFNYLREYSNEEAEAYFEEENKLSTNYSSLTYILNKRGINFQ